MKRLVNYLERNTMLNAGALLVYFLFLIFLHDTFVNLSVTIMNTLSLSIYDKVVGSITLSFLAFFIFLFIKNLRAERERTDLKITYLLIVTGLVIVHSQMNFVMNIEIIHTLQFGILAVLIFPLTRSFGATLYYTVLFGAVDEWYQYQVLYPQKSDYFDFNDLVLDQLGAGLALVFLYTAGLNNLRNSNKWYQSPVFLSMAVFAIGAAVLFRFSLITVYYKEGTRALMTLSKANDAEAFWRHLPNCDIVYHVMSPLEGLLAVTAICGLFFLLDVLAGKERGTTSQTPELNSKPVLQGVN
ncbi:MAG TPA: VanZ family protein [Chitinophagales bacterium]|nr:VanZ family protein [Chitinophagales bacterium]